MCGKHHVRVADDQFVVTIHLARSPKRPATLLPFAASAVMHWGRTHLSTPTYYSTLLAQRSLGNGPISDYQIHLPTG